MGQIVPEICPFQAREGDRGVMAVQKIGTYWKIGAYDDAGFKYRPMSLFSRKYSIFKRKRHSCSPRERCWTGFCWCPAEGFGSAGRFVRRGSIHGKYPTRETRIQVPIINWEKYLAGDQNVLHSIEGLPDIMSSRPEIIFVRTEHVGSGNESETKA